MRTLLAAFGALGIGSLILIGNYAARDIGPAQSREQAQKLDVVYRDQVYAVSQCRVQVELESNLVTATCRDPNALITPAPTYSHSNSSSWPDVRFLTDRELLLFSGCVRYGENVQCERLKTESRHAGD
jgi:hypothetical protein